MIPQATVALGAAYLLGGIPFGLILHRLAGRGDLRQRGSGNIGATNVFRSAGRTLGILTLVLDISKGALAVVLVRAVSGGEVWEAAGACAVVVGHCFPIYLGFRGGKGIAAGCGAYAVLAPMPMVWTLGIFLAVMMLTRMVSAGSIAAGLMMPLFILWLQPRPGLLISVVTTVLVVTARHHSNIRRIISGREHRINGS
ncbi:MAG: glycerol-3-phosphate 1-O-acyltransferase PlsY [Acidobacteriota bacterium]